MKIVYLCPSGQLGGAERCLLDLLAGIRSVRGLHPHVVHLADGPVLDECLKLGIPGTQLPLPKRLAQLGDDSALEIWGLPVLLTELGFFLHRFNALLRHLKPDIIHSNGIKPNLLLRLVNTGAARIIWHVHDYSVERPRSSRLLQWASRKTAEAVTNSHSVAASLSEKIPALPVRCIHNGIDTEEFSPAEGDSSLLDTLSGLPVAEKDILRLGLVATFAKWKGHLMFIQAAEALSRQLPRRKLRFYIIGGPIYHTSGSQFSEAELRTAVNQAGLTKEFGFIPFQNTPARIYRALDIVVHASTQPEPFGRTIAEAMACGRPTVVANAGGAREIIEPNVDALGYPPGDLDEFVKQLAALCGSEKLRRTLGKNARNKIVTQFSRSQYVQNWIDTYERREKKQSLSSAGGSHEIVVAMGYREDNWHSMRIVTEGLSGALQEVGKPPFRHPQLFMPSCGHRPGWIDRRIRYPKMLPSGEVFQLMDHSYADCLFEARNLFQHLVVVIHDTAFWRTRSLANYYFRDKILRGLGIAHARIAVSHATANEIENVLGLTVDAIIPWGLPIGAFTHSRKKRNPALLLMVGSNQPRKGIERALHLLAGLPSSFRLIRVGDGLSHRQRSLAVQLGVASRIDERGNCDRDALMHLYETVGTVLYPSSYEGFGLPVVEARLCGTRVLASEEVPVLHYLAGDPGTIPIRFSEFDHMTPSEAKKRCYQIVMDGPPSPIELLNRDFFGWKRVVADYCRLYEKLIGVREGRLGNVRPAI